MEIRGRAIACVIVLHIALAGCASRNQGESSSATADSPCANCQTASQDETFQTSGSSGSGTTGSGSGSATWHAGSAATLGAADREDEKHASEGTASEPDRSAVPMHDGGFNQREPVVQSAERSRDRGDRGTAAKTEAPASAGNAGTSAMVLADLGHLPMGSGAVSAPRTVQRNEVFTVVLRVARQRVQHIINELGGQKAPNLQINGKNGIRLSRWMTATLHAPELVIEPNVPVRQSVTEQEGATWKWLVRAPKGGQYTLRVDATVEVASGPNKDVHTFDSYSHDLTVHVSWSDWLQDHWQWLSGAVFLPLAATSWRSWRRQRAATPNWDG